MKRGAFAAQNDEAPAQYAAESGSNDSARSSPRSRGSTRSNLDGPENEADEEVDEELRLFESSVRDGSVESPMDASLSASLASFSAEGAPHARRKATGNTHIIARRASAWDRAAHRKKADDTGFTGFTSNVTAGSLEVELLNGRNVSKSAQGYFADSFVEVFFNGLLAGKSQIIRQEKSPVWNYKVVIELPADREYEECLLTLVLYDADGGEGEDWRANYPDDESDVTAKQHKKEKKYAKERGGSFGAALFGALAASVGLAHGERSKARKVLGRINIEGTDLAVVGALRTTENTKWFQAFDDKGLMKGEIEVSAHHTPHVVEHALKDVITTKKSSDTDDAGSIVSNESKSSEEDDDDDDDDLDGEDTLQIQILAAKNLSKVDMMGNSDPYAIVFYNKEEIGRTVVVSNNLYPRWDMQLFQIYVPAGSGCTNEDGEDGELLIELYDKSNFGSDTFLGCTKVAGLDLKNLLGFIAKKNKKGIIDDDSVATVSTGHGSEVTVERGYAHWFQLEKSKEKSIKENKFVKGAVQLSGTYISGKLVAGEGPLSATVPHHRVTLNIVAAQQLPLTPENAIKKSFLGGSKKVKQNGEQCSSMCVVRWNGSEVGRTGVVSNTTKPNYFDSILIRVPPVWTIRQCELEIAVHGELPLTGGLGVFLGQANVKGEELVQLLSGALVDGVPKRSSFLLQKSEHYPIEDQTLVGGLIDLTGCVEMEQAESHGRANDRRSALTGSIQFSASQFASLDSTVDISQIKNIHRLEVTVLECSELMQADKFGSANAFVTAIWNGREKRSTAVCYNELNPTWENEVFHLPIPSCVMLADCTLELVVKNKSRLGTISFMGETSVTGMKLENLATSRGEPLWYDLNRNRYLDDKQNGLCQGCMRISCEVFDDDGERVFPTKASEGYQPNRINLNVMGLTCMPPRIGVPKMILVTSRCQPYLQFLWNGSEAGCTASLSVPYIDLDYHAKYMWLSEYFTFIIPEDTPLHKCELQIWMWDKGIKEESGEDTFCGMRVLTGPELHLLVCKTTDSATFERRLKQAKQDGTKLESEKVMSYAMQKSWTLPEELQKFAKGQVSIVANYVPEVQAPVMEIEELTDEEVEMDDLNDEDNDDAEKIDAFDEQKETGVMVIGDTGESRALVITEDSYVDEYAHLTEEEKQQIIQQELDDYWQNEKERHQIIIPDGASSHFTKHYDESLGKFYYYDHVSGLTTWDKPVGDIKLYLSDEQIDKIRQIHERRHAIASGQEADLKDIRQIVLKKMKKEKEFEVQQHRARMKAELERQNKNVWQRVLMDASLTHGHLSLSWHKLGYIDPVVFDFANNFGYSLVSLRLIGIGLKHLPEDFGFQFTQLSFLSLSNNELTYLPDSFVQMTSLQEVNLLKNKLEKLPERIGLMSSLQKLEVANNYLRALPITFAALNLMQRIDVECNKLQVLPENLDNLTSCTTIICNYNELLRLPRCLGAMPSLTSLSATNNKINYIPQEVTDCKTLKILRLSLNKITNVPDKLGSMKRLRELTIDYNNLFKLPMSFYQLVKIKTLRIEGNENLSDPPPDIIGQGAQAVVLYFKKRYEEDITWRQRVIISSVQAVLAQAHERNMTDPAQFEPNTRVENSEDGWFALQLSYFWSELLPELKRIWRDEGMQNKHNPNWINSFPFDEREVLWAFSNFSDAYGVMLKRQKVRFRRCACVDGTGRRRPCVPPAVGFMCFRVATLLKMHFVMSGHRKERMWIAYKKAGIEEAVKAAEAEALKYLHSSVGKLWVETEAYRQAEVILNAMGGEAQQQWRTKALEMKQSSIIAHYDRKIAYVEKIRTSKAAVFQEELDNVREEWKKAKEGYMKTTLETQMQELIGQISNMDENVHIHRLSTECERKCKDAVDQVYDADSTDSSDSDASLPDSEDESELAVLRRERYVRRYEEDRDNDKLARRKDPLSEMPIPPLDYAVKKAKEALMPVIGVLFPHNRAREKRRAALYKRLKKSVNQVLDVVDIRVRKFYMKVGGNFDEIQKESKHELYRQYLETNIEQARERAKNEFDVIDQVRQSMGGVGVEKIFKAWKRWALNKLQRLRRDARAEFRTSTKIFTAAMESVDIAQARVDMWKKRTDIYTETSFWVNELTQEITAEKPGLEHFLPPSFEMPPPPKRLPAGVSEDTSSDESDHAFRKVTAKEAIKAARAKKEAEAKKLEKENKKKRRMEARKNPRAIKDNDDDDDSGEESDDESDLSISSDSSTESSEGRTNDIEGAFRDDISALSETSSVALANEVAKLPEIVRRNSDAAHELQAARTYLATKANDAIGLGDESIRNQFSVKKNVGSATGSVMSSEVSLSSFNYGPDSLRGIQTNNKKKTSAFDEEIVGEAPLSDLDLRVLAAREYLKGLEGTENEQKRVNFVMEPTDMIEVRNVSKQRAEDEVNIADRIIRKKRSGLSVMRHQTYMHQANRIQRSVEENAAIRKAQEAELEVYSKPELDDLLELAGGDVRMTNLPGPEGVHLRTVLAHRALYVEKKLHDRAVKKKLAEPKPWTVVGHYIAPIWRENAQNSEDEDSDNEEEKLEKARRKGMRKEERRKAAEEIIEANALEEAVSVNSAPTVNTKIPLEDRMGKPRQAKK